MFDGTGAHGFGDGVVEGDFGSVEQQALEGTQQQGKHQHRHDGCLDSAGATLAAFGVLVFGYLF